MLALSLLKSLACIRKFYELNILKICGRARLIDKVNGLIRQISVRDISF